MICWGHSKTCFVIGVEMILSETCYCDLISNPNDEGFPGDLHQLVDIRHRLGILDRRWRLVSMKLLNVGNPLLNHLYFRLYKIKMETEASFFFVKKKNLCLSSRVLHPLHPASSSTRLLAHWPQLELRKYKTCQRTNPKNKKNRSKNPLGGQEW